jgi:hypothetical protein
MLGIASHPARSHAARCRRPLPSPALPACLQGIGFAGRGAQASSLPAWEERDDNDVVARNRRIRASLYGGTLAEEVGGWAPVVMFCWFGC